MTTTISVLLLAADFPPHSGGIARYLYDIVSHLPAQQVRVIALPTAGWQAFDAAQTFYVQRLALPSAWGPSSSQFKLLAPFYFFAALHYTPDIVLCGQAHHSLILAAWMLRCIKRTKYGVFAYGSDLLRPQQRRYRNLFNALLRKADIVFADSQKAAEIAVSLGSSSEHTHIVNPAVNTSRLDRCQTTSELVRRRFELDGKRVILTVGRLVERKGHDIIIQALPRILETVPDAHYLIVGRGPMEERLRELVLEIGVEKHVTFAGYVPDNDLAAYYRTCDVFAMVSRENFEKGDIEGFGIVYLEASYFSRPIVAGRSGGVADAVADGESGILVEPCDIQAVERAIVNLLENRVYAACLGKQGYERVQTYFSSMSPAKRVLCVLAKDL